MLTICDIWRHLFTQFALVFLRSFRLNLNVTYKQR